MFYYFNIINNIGSAFLREKARKLWYKNIFNNDNGNTIYEGGESLEQLRGERFPTGHNPPSPPSLTFLPPKAQTAKLLSPGENRHRIFVAHLALKHVFLPYQLHKQLRQLKRKKLFQIHKKAKQIYQFCMANSKLI